jgi:hypothetical protein
VELLTITDYQPNKESLNSDGQQFHHYQQNKESLISGGHQFHHYQQNKERLNSDGLLTITV